ncbi:MAG: hypothetical protein BEN19_06445 [Epulopiscium sp. Nuni2H_MBin003]|nr:MAG: hypothetical protein BEN19_06445 [Epulopiscium sp. Nuni2H_MBin003]
MSKNLRKRVLQLTFGATLATATSLTFAEELYAPPGYEWKEITLYLNQSSIEDNTNNDEVTEDLNMSITITHPTTNLSIDGAIEIAATGADSLEYSLDNLNWQSYNTFTELNEGVYSIYVRDGNNTINRISQIVELVGITIEEVDLGDIVDGFYTVDVNILKEYTNEDSMANAFFKSEDLNLLINDGKYYLTIVVNNEGAFGGVYYEPEIITLLEQRTDTGHTTLSLDKKETEAGLQYITTVVEFDDLEETAYIRATIAPMNNIPQTLRIEMITSTLTPGTASEEPDIDELDTAISNLEIENGCISITLNQEDDTLTSSSFSAYMLYGELAEDATDLGDAISLSDFTMNSTDVTFTFDEVEAMQKDQIITISIVVNEQDAVSQSFIVEALYQRLFTLKDNAINIPYATGYADGTFKPYQAITRNESFEMMGKLIDVIPQYYQIIDAAATALTPPIANTVGANQLFTTKDILIEETDIGYKLTIDITNSGFGNDDIITSVEQQIDGEFKHLLVRKSIDNKIATITVYVPNLEDELILRVDTSPAIDMSTHTLSWEELLASLEANDANKQEVSLSFDVSTLEELLETTEQAHNRIYTLFGLTSANGDNPLTRAEFAELITNFGYLIDDRADELALIENILNEVPIRSLATLLESLSSEYIALLLEDLLQQAMSTYADDEISTYASNLVSTLQHKYATQQSLEDTEVIAVGLIDVDDNDTTSLIGSILSAGSIYTHFSDVPTYHSSFDSIFLAQRAGFIQSYEDGTFAPDEHATRAAAVTMINKLIGDTTNIAGAKMPFDDVDPTLEEYVDILRALN